MNDKEKVLRWLDLEDDGLICIPKMPPEWWIATISTHFAELGISVILRKPTNDSEYYIIRLEKEMHGGYRFPVLYSFCYKESIIGHGTTALEAWMNAAKNNVNGGKT